MATASDQHHFSGHIISYPRFLWRVLVKSTDGNLLFYTWMTFLTALFLVGVNAWAHQVVQGMVLTNMTDHVSWGLYIANFTFMVGLAAGGVMMAIPAYLYHDEEMHDIVIIGELLAVAAIVMCLLFVTVDLGRPDRFWHLIPGIGRFNWPMSMLTWDVIVLNVYLLLNLHICGYLLYMRYLGRHPETKWYVPIVFISIIWAISIHTVTAFLYSGLGGRPFWNSAVLAPRFLASAFVSGPAFILLTIAALNRFGGVRIGPGPGMTLLRILRVTCLINLFLLGSEMFTEFYTGGEHAAPAYYLFFGLHGHYELVPWTWSALFLNTTAAIIFLWPGIERRQRLVLAACAMTFVGVWIEKGMGLIVPGFVPSTMHELVPYVPSVTEWKVMVGIWALGLMIYTVALKIAVWVMKNKAGRLVLDEPS